MPGERPPAPGPAGGPPRGASDGTLEAARAVLGTLAAGRAALLQLAASHLPFDRLLALHRDAASDLSAEDTAGAMVERRLALHLRALRPDTGTPYGVPVFVTPQVAPVVTGAPAPVASAPIVAPAPVVTAPIVAPIPVPAPIAPVASASADGQRRAADRMARSLLYDRSSSPAAAPRPQPLTEQRPAGDPVVDALRDLAQAAARPTPIEPAPRIEHAPRIESPPRIESAPVTPAPVIPAPIAVPPPRAAVAPVRMAPILLASIAEEPVAPAEATFEPAQDRAEPTSELPDLHTIDFTPLDTSDEMTPRAAPVVAAPVVAEPVVVAPVAPTAPAPAAESFPSLSDLLAAAPLAEPDATVVAALTIAPPTLLSPELSDWAAGALGAEPAARSPRSSRSAPTPAAPPAAPPPAAPEVRVAEGAVFQGAPMEEGVSLLDPHEPHEHSVLDFRPAHEGAPAAPVRPARVNTLPPVLPEAPEPPSRAAGRFDEETISLKAADRASLPTLREPRVSGSSAARLDMRAAGLGAAPRLAGADEELDLPADEEPNEDNVVEIRGESADSNLSVSFESNAPIRTLRGAPRLTEDDPDDRTNPAADFPPPVRESVVPDEKQVQQLLVDANALARRGDFQKAIQLFTDALDMRYNLVEAHIGRGRCHLELGDYSSAMSDFARAEDHAPDRPESHVAMGDLYFARKEYKRAIEFYDQAVEIDGSHAMARCRRGISHYYRKNYRQAQQDLQRALALDPEIPNIRKYVQMAQKKLEKGE